MPRKPRTSPRRAPTQRRALNTVTTLLDATEIVLSRRGFAATTTNHVAVAAGVSIGTLYHYFPSTEALIEAAVHRMWKRALDVLAAHQETLASGSLGTAVRGMATDLVGVMAARRVLSRRWNSEASHLGRLDAGLERTAMAWAAVQKALEGRGDELRRANRAFAADFVVKLARSMVRTGARVWPDETESGELAVEWTDLVTRCLVADEAP
jgi:AcrR family transcriptional regulator